MGPFDEKSFNTKVTQLLADELFGSEMFETFNENMPLLEPFIFEKISDKNDMGLESYCAEILLEKMFCQHRLSFAKKPQYRKTFQRITDEYFQVCREMMDDDFRFCSDIFSRHNWNELRAQLSPPTLPHFKKVNIKVQVGDDNYQKCVELLTKAVCNGIYTYAKKNKIRIKKIPSIDTDYFVKYTRLKIWSDNPRLYLWNKRFFEECIPKAVEDIIYIIHTPSIMQSFDIE